MEMSTRLGPAAVRQRSNAAATPRAASSAKVASAVRTMAGPATSGTRARRRRSRASSDTSASATGPVIGRRWMKRSHAKTPTRRQYPATIHSRATASARATAAASTTVAPSATATATTAWRQSTAVAEPAIEAGLCSRAVGCLHAPDPRLRPGSGVSCPLVDALHQRVPLVRLGVARLACARDLEHEVPPCVEELVALRQTAEEGRAHEPCGGDAIAANLEAHVERACVQPASRDVDAW